MKAHCVAGRLVLDKPRHVAGVCFEHVAFALRCLPANRQAGRCYGETVPFRVTPEYDWYARTLT